MENYIIWQGEGNYFGFYHFTFYLWKKVASDDFRGTYLESKPNYKDWEGEDPIQSE